MSQLESANQPAIELSPRAKLEILGAILLALFLFALDQTVVGTALPRIVTDLNGDNLYTWVVTVYLLTATISGPIYGKLSDLFGRRPIVIWAVSLFLVSSVLSGLSQQMWQLILFRGLQGLGGGAIFPVALAVVADLYTPAERGKYLGLFGAVFGLSSLLGPGIGGFITDTVHAGTGSSSSTCRSGWSRSSSCCACCRPSAGRRRPATSTTSARPSFALAIAPVPGRPDQQADRRLDRPGGRRPDPARPGLRRSCSSGSSRACPSRSCRSASSGSARSRSRSRACSWPRSGSSRAVIFLPRWFQSVAGASATESGYNLLPLLAALIFSAIASGQIVARTGRYKLLMFGSLLLLAAGLFLLTNLRADTDRPIAVAVDGRRRPRASARRSPSSRSSSRTRSTPAASASRRPA